jgi:predicted TIM-barrel fold metal-dependent hydrolase
MAVPAPTPESQSIIGVRHSRPARPAPAGACDCHTHVFGAADRYPYDPARTYTPDVAPTEQLAELNRWLGLGRVVIVQPSPYGSDNRATLDGVARLGELGVQARAVAVIDPHRIADDELDALHRAGVRGVRVNLESAGIHDPAQAAREFQVTAERVAPLGWHVQTFTNLGVLQAVADTLGNLPAPLVVDHFGSAKAALGTGQPGFAALLDLVRAGKSYVKLSAPHRISEEPGGAAVRELARALIEANPQRALWGTDWPHPGGRPGARSPDRVERFNPKDDGYALNLLYDWVESEDELQRILVDNPARLYQF